jgi:hypothetical protein
MLRVSNLQHRPRSERGNEMRKHTLVQVTLLIATLAFAYGMEVLT